VEETYRRKKLGIQLLTDSAFKKLLAAPGEFDVNTSYPYNYDILSNFEYQRKFGYEPVYQRETIEVDISFSDLMTKALYGGYTLAKAEEPFEIFGI
jgi:hypothetical protein